MLMDFLSRTFSKRPSLFAGVAILFTFLAVWGISTVRFAESPRELFRSGDQSYSDLERLYEDFGSDDRDCVVLLESKDLLSEETCAIIRSLDRELALIEGVEEVTSLADLSVTGSLIPKPLLPKEGADERARLAARDAIKTHPLGLDQLVDSGYSSTLIFVRMTSGDLTVKEMTPTIEGIEAALAAVKAPPGLQLSLTGIPPLRVAIFGTIKREQRMLSLLGMVLSLGVSCLLFRKLGPVLIAGIPSLFSGIWAAGLVGWTGVPFDILTAQLPLLVQIIALCDSVHLTNHILLRRSAGDTPREAAVSSLKNLGSACLLTTFTTAVGFLSLVVSRADAIQKFGLLFGISVLAAFFAVILLVPLCTILFLRGEPSSQSVRHEARLRRVVQRILPPILARPRLSSAIGLLLTALTCTAALSLSPDNRLAESSPEGDPATEALFRIESLYGGLVSSTVRVDWPMELDSSDPSILAALGSAKEAFAASPIHREALSIKELLPLVPGIEAKPGSADPRLAILETLDEDALASLWRPDIGSAVLIARLPDVHSDQVEEAHRNVQAALTELEPLYPGFTFTLTGTGVVARRNIDTIISDLARGLFIAAVTIFFALSLFLRSWRLGLLSLIPNVLPLSITATALVLLDQPLQVSSAIAFSVCLGIAVDDTIHFLHRWRKERLLTDSAREAALETCVGVGLPILVTSFILAAGFSALLPSVVGTTRVFAWIILGGLATAVLADVLLLPALLVATDKKKDKALDQ
jgi:predicted RND superfamily exporter protein